MFIKVNDERREETTNAQASETNLVPTSLQAASEQMGKKEKNSTEL